MRDAIQVIRDSGASKLCESGHPMTIDEAEMISHAPAYVFDERVQIVWQCPTCQEKARKKAEKQRLTREQYLANLEIGNLTEHKRQVLYAFLAEAVRQMDSGAFKPENADAQEIKAILVLLKQKWAV